MSEKSKNLITNMGSGEIKELDYGLPFAFGGIVGTKLSMSSPYPLIELNDYVAEIELDPFGSLT